MYFEDSLPTHFWPAYSSLSSFAKSEPASRIIPPELHEFIKDLIEKHSKKPKIDFEKTMLDHKPDWMFTELERQ